MIVRFDAPELAEKRFKELAEEYEQPIRHGDNDWFAVENYKYDFTAVYDLKGDAVRLVFYLGTVECLQTLWAMQKMMREV